MNHDWPEWMQKPVISGRTGKVLFGQYVLQRLKKKNNQTEVFTLNLSEDYERRFYRIVCDLRDFRNRSEEYCWNYLSLIKKTDSIEDIVDKLDEILPKEEPELLPQEVLTAVEPLSSWQLNKHRLKVIGMQGFEKEDYKNKADVILFDPPFDQAGLYDYIPESKFAHNIVVFADPLRIGEAISKAYDRGWPFFVEIIWNLISSYFRPGRPMTGHCSALVFGRKYWNFKAATIRDKDGKWKRLGTVYNKQKSKNGAGYGKPIELLRAILLGLDAWNVIDLFIGSGSSLVVGEQIGCEIIGYEIDPISASRAIVRWENYTGKKAVEVLM